MFDIEKFKKALDDNLGNKRYEHSKYVAKEAISLAKEYGADEKKAEVAGLLHDIMKEEDFDKQLKIIEKGGVKLSHIEKVEKCLIHQISSMVYARDELGVDDEDILNAIRYHTSARANMSLLEKIIFVADSISKDRDYDGVDEIRKAAKKSLEAAMVESLSVTINELLADKDYIVTDTIEAYNVALKIVRED